MLYHKEFRNITSRYYDFTKRLLNRMINHGAILLYLLSYLPHNSINAKILAQSKDLNRSRLLWCMTIEQLFFEPQ